MPSYGIDGETIVRDHLLQVGHEGKLYELYYETLNLTSPLYFIVDTGSKFMHYSFNLEATGRTKIEVFVGSTVDDEGTPWVPARYNTALKASTEVSARQGVTVSADGTLIPPSKTIFGITTGVSRVATPLEQGIERIAPVNSRFVLKFSTLDSGSWLRISLVFHEENF